MPKNVQSSSGIAEDLIRAIQQMCCAELHLITLYEKTVAEMENGLVDVSDSDTLTKHIEKAEQYKEDIITSTEIRRQMMSKLFSMFDDGDKDVWCMFKHLSSATYCAWEVYLASDDDPELLSIAVDTNKMFTRFTTQFLGMEITDCASCLNDMLKAEKS